MVQIGEDEITPSKIVCLGRNYIEHAKEMSSPVPREPVFFVKTTNCLISNNEPIRYPLALYNSEDFNRVDFEVELAFILKEKCKFIKAEDVYDNILGITILIDFTARKMQISDRNKNLPWYRSKNFDTFAPVGPKIVKLSEIGDPHNLSIKLTQNGEVRQNSNTKNMIFKIPQIMEYLSKYLTFYKHDIIATGTPEGVGPIEPGDIIEASIQNVGTITHKIVLEPPNNN